MRAVRLLLIAAAAAGAVLLGLAAIILAGGSQPLGIDHWVHDRAAGLANDGVISVGRGITHMGDSLVAWISAGTVAFALAGALGIWLWTRRDRTPETARPRGGGASSRSG